MTDASGSRATRVERFSWCLFDFANSAFNTIVVTFVYAAFFAGVLVGDQVEGDRLWSRALAVAGITVALLSPVLGVVADRTAHKRRFVVVLSLITIACTVGLYFPAVAAGAKAATPAVVLTALVLVTVANVAFELMFVFYNAFLPGLGTPQTIGRLSGYGWAFGYAGGLACLAICLGCVGVGDLEPWLPTAGDQHIRTTNLVVAAWFGLFALPMFLLVRDHTARPPQPVSIAGALAAVGHTLRALPRYPDLARLLLARLFYNDAVIALIGLSGLYMRGSLGMEVSEIMLVAIWLNVAAGLGALGFGFVDDFVGGKAAVVGSLVLLLAGAIVAILSTSIALFVVAATLVGLGMGPNQAASRTMLARFTPAERSAEFYGLFALSGKATVWIGPLLFDLVRGATRDSADSQRYALLPIVGMLLVGLWLIAGVDEKRGMR